MTTITMLQKKIVKALETGQDPAPLLKELAELRAKIASEGELAELQKVANERQQLKDRAKGIVAKVEKQSKAIDKFLLARDSLVKQLQPLLEPMSELAKLGASSWEREPGECYLYNDITVFSADARSVPEGYLPKGFGCPFLSMAGGQTDARGKAVEAYRDLGSAIGFLKGFEKGLITTGFGKADNPLIENEVETSCRVCQHPKAEAINKALTEGKSLRAIEEEYNVPRSTLSRHKNNCLNLGVIRIKE